MDNAVIHLARRPAWADLLRSYQIFVDGKLMGAIRQGKSCTLQIHPGYHELYLAIDWCSSQHLFLYLAPGEETTLICQGRNAWLTMYNISFGTNDYIKLFQEPIKDVLLS